MSQWEDDKGESKFKKVCQTFHNRKGIGDCVVLYYWLSATGFQQRFYQAERTAVGGKREGEEEEWVVFQDSRQRERQLQRL